MKINEIKHNHSLTDLLKVLLFSILMILPFLSVATRCLYVVCNKNAKDSYSDNSIQISYQELSSFPVKDVYFDFNKYSYGSEFSANNARPRFYFDNLEYISGNLSTSLRDSLIAQQQFKIWYDNGYPYCTWSNAGTNISSNTYNFIIKGTIIGYNEFVGDTTYLDDLFYTESQTNYLDNAFEYSVNKLEDNNLFNWVENTGVYTGVKAMTDNLQIDMLVIPMIVTYWFLLTVIYVIIDLILKAFTTLTHMLIKKA